MLRTPLLIVSASALLLTACIHADWGANSRESFHYNYDLKPGGRVSLQGFNGHIEVAGWDKDSVEVEGEKSASSEANLKRIRIETRHEADVVEIRATQGSSAGWFSGSGVSYTVHMPKKAALSAHTSNGHIELRDLEGAARLKTSNGRIHGDGVSGSVEADTSNGRIELNGLTAETRVETSNGSVTLGFARPPAGAVHASSSNGPIAVRLPRETTAHVEARTSNGQIVSDFELSAEPSREKTRLSADIGRGGALMELQTSNGRITLTRN
jgi:DUF4097 and DUF4098 domain-containing protein YvlB